METDEGEKSNNLIPAISLQKQESVVITSKSNCENSSAPPTEESADLQVVTTQAEEQNSSGNVSKDMESNEMTGITAMNNGHSTQEEEMHLEHDMQTEQESAGLDVSALPSSSTSDKMVLGEVLLATERRPTHKSPPKMCEVENVSVMTKDDQSEIFPKMDQSLCPENVGKTETVVGGESPKGNVKAEQMGELLSVTSNSPPSAITEMRESEVVNKEQCFEMETSHLDSGSRVASPDISVVKPQEDNECLDISRKPFEETNGNDTEESSGVGTFTSESPVGSALMVKDTEEEFLQGTLETLSKTSVAESLEESKFLSGSQDTETVNWKLLKKSTHSICKMLSPVCLFPTMRVQALKPQPSPESNHISRRISPNKNTLQSEKNSQEDGIAEMATLEVSHQKGKRKGQSRKCISRTISPVVSLKTSASTRNEESKMCQNTTNGVDIQCPQFIREEEPEAVADSTTAQTESLGLVHSEMGPPLPRLLTPLTTPPKVGKLIHPRQAIGKLSFPSPMEGTASPSTPTQTNVTPTGQQLSSSSLNSPLHPNGVPSSPLQFGSATPKHAVPVPGRLPSTALNSSSSSSSPSQENSMRILDTMYPELSAHGRTLSILRGNVSLGICSSASGTLPVTSISQVSCFKTVNSTSTAFTKTDTKGTKRQISPFPEERIRKIVKMDDGSDVTRKQVLSSSSNSSEDTASPLTQEFSHLTHGAEEKLIDDALKKIEHQCFDLLPVIQSHLYVGNKPKKPVLRSEETEVISEVCQNRLVSTFI